MITLVLLPSFIQSAFQHCEATQPQDSGVAGRGWTLDDQVESDLNDQEDRGFNVSFQGQTCHLDQGVQRLLLFLSILYWMIASWLAWRLRGIIRGLYRIPE